MGRARRHAGRLTVIAVLAALLVCIGLFVRAYRNAGPEGVPEADAPTPVPTPVPTVQPAVGGPPVVVGSAAPDVTLSPGGYGGFTFGTVPSHRLVMSATSTAPIGTVGYLAPTSADHSYGSAEHVGRHWTVTTRVLGKPQYAAVFVQAGASGAPITCTVSVDGKVVSRRTTSGAYGREVCVG
jgi:hypothetical protein